MDTRSYAYLNKQKDEVRCGSCGKTLAYIFELAHKYEGQWCIHRAVVLDSAFFGGPDGVIRLTKHAAESMKRGRLPQVRRQREILRYKRAMYTEATLAGERSEGEEQFPLPARVQCPNHPWISVQILDASRLVLTLPWAHRGFGSPFPHPLAYLWGVPSAMKLTVPIEVKWDDDCGKLVRSTA